jgi:hypothetical protein
MKFLGVQACHGSEETKQKENHPTDDRTAEHDDTLVKLPEELVVVRSLAENLVFVKEKRKQFVIIS